MRRPHGATREVVPGEVLGMSPYLAMCLMFMGYARIVALTYFLYGAPAAVGVLLAIGLM